MEQRAGERFCDACQKCVIDFSGYTNAEIIQALSNATGEVCGRLTQTQLDQLNYHLVLAPAQRNWMKYLGVLAIGASIFAQTANATVPKEIPAIETSLNAKPGDPKPLKIKRIYGYVLDGDKKPLSGIEVRIANTQLIAKTDKNGRYEIKLGAGFNVKNKQLLFSDNQMELAKFNVDYSKEKQQELTLVINSFIMGKIAMPMKSQSVKIIDSLGKQ